MKSRMLAIATLATALSLSAVSARADVVPSDAHGPAAAAPAAAPIAASPLAPALGEFGLYLLRETARRDGTPDTNAVVSPFGLANALGLLALGAEGDTAREITGLLEPGVAAGRLLRAGMRSLDDDLAQPQGSDVLVENATRLWLRADLANGLSPVFVAAAQHDYRAQGVAIDFGAGEAARSTINAWAEQATGGHVRTLLPADSLPADTQAVLTNAVYFRAPWAHPFDPAATAPMPFHLEGDATVTVPTMRGAIRVRHGEVDGIPLIEIPYAGDRFSLLLALVPPGHTLDAVQKDLGGWTMIEGLRGLRSEDVLLQLPRFRIDPRAASIKAALQAAGMQRAFRKGADFSGLVPGSALVVGDVWHAAGIVVDEAGAEATAATAATMRPKGLIQTPLVLAVDRPFVFAIVHRASGVPLFVGRVANPAGR